MTETTAHILRQIAQFPSDQHFTALKTAMYFGMRHDYGSFPLFPTVEAVDSEAIAKAADYVNAGGSLEDFLSCLCDGSGATLNDHLEYDGEPCPVHG